MTINIKEIRKKAGLTQHQLADKIGIARTQISKWENGESSPTLHWVEKIGKVLGYQVASLTDDTLNDSASSEADETLIWELTRLLAEKAREFPDLSSGHIGAIGMTLWRDVKSGKISMPTEKHTGKKPTPKVLVTQANDLIAYERSRPNL